MALRPTAAALAVAATLCTAGPAFGDSYRVTGVTDPPGAACTLEGNAETVSLYACTSVRAALAAANANPDASDLVMLPAGTYQLAQGELTIEAGVSLFGSGARDTRIQGDGQARVVRVPLGADASIFGLTIAGGTGGSGKGGNILNEGQLTVFQSRITGGSAGTGGGIANVGGDLSITQSLIDDNSAIFSGGGIDNEGVVSTVSYDADLQVTDSTITGNSGSTGGGIATGGNSANSAELLHVTLTRNDQGGFFITSPQPAGMYGSIVAGNTGATNCQSTNKPVNRGYNIDDGTSCNFSGSGSLSATDPQLSANLVNRGGPTDVFSIESSSPAANLVAVCASGVDQRGFPRLSTGLEPCDAGAYEIGELTQPPPEETPTPDPTPTPPPPPTPTAIPTPVATATPVPTPEFKETVVVRPISGTVRICPVRLDRCTVLAAGAAIPLGATVDTKKGVVELAAVPKAGAAPETAKFRDGIFKVTQRSSTTDLTLNEPLAACKKAKSATAAAAKPKSRKLWGDGKGKFRTNGQYSAATVRGTEWLVQDSCAGTLTRVRTGTVSVRDKVKRKTIRLRAGKSYLAKPRR